MTKDTQEILARAVNSSSNIQRTVRDVALVLNNLSNSCYKLSETINLLKLLSKHIAQQSMSLTRSLNLSRIEQGNQKPILDLSDRIFALIQKLFETTAKIEPLFANIQTEIREKEIPLESEIQQSLGGVEELQTASQKLERIVDLNHEMSNFIENISNSLETQIQSSNFTKYSVREVEAIAERISEQSISVTQFFNQLMTLVKSDVN
ncbi:MAG: hypothetical protein QNJ41_14620 [Xenococcaceae cyanobacterium MO_188.B32]|nr:hypothetical protein [Xenococcaceae cyanobacterium MO_188.B32]